MHQRIVGDKHLKLVLSPDGAPDRLLDAIAFNVDTDAWPNPGAERVEVAYRLDCNYYRGEERLQLMVEVLKLA